MIETGIGQRQAKCILPVYPAAHRVGGLPIGQAFHVLQHGSQGEPTRCFGWLAAAREQRGELTILVNRAERVRDKQVGGALGKCRTRNAAGFVGNCGRVLRVQRHWSALAGCESARLACRPSIRLLQNDRPPKNDRKESGYGLTRIVLALQSLTTNQSCFRWPRRSSCLAQVPPMAGRRRRCRIRHQCQCWFQADRYAWLAQRLHRIDPNRPAFIQWPALMQQFGSGYGPMSHRKGPFRTALQQVITRYDAARTACRSSDGDGRAAADAGHRLSAEQHQDHSRERTGSRSEAPGEVIRAEMSEDDATAPRAED